MELLIASVLLGVIYMGISSVYISAQRFTKDASARQYRLEAALAMETMERQMISGRAVAIEVTPGVGTYAGCQIKVQIDTTPTDANDNNFQWLKYRFLNNTLRTRTDAAQAGDVGAADTEVSPSLMIVMGATSSFFAIDATTANIVHINLMANGGSQRPWAGWVGANESLHTEVMLRSMAA